MSDKRAISESYFMPAANVECFWDFQYTDQSFIVSHSQEVLPGCWEKNKTIWGLNNVRKGTKCYSLSFSNNPIISIFKCG